MITKTDAVKIFGSNNALAAAMGVTYVTVSTWPEELPEAVADRFIGCLVRHGVVKAEFDAMEKTMFADHNYKGLEVKF